MLWTRSSFNCEWVKGDSIRLRGASVEASLGSCSVIPRMLSIRPCDWVEAWPLLQPERSKAMVAYLKASANEKMYSDYLHAAWEAEKEEVMEPSINQTAATMSKPKATSFFPLQKLKGSQPTKTSVVWVAHLEEENGDKEECTDSKDPDGIKGMTEEFIVCLTRVVKDAQQEEKCCYHCSSSDHFIHDCLLVVASRTDSHLNLREGMVPRKGAWAPQGKAITLKVPQDGAPTA